MTWGMWRRIWSKRYEESPEALLLPGELCEERTTLDHLECHEQPRFKAWDGQFQPKTRQREPSAGCLPSV